MIPLVPILATTAALMVVILIAARRSTTNVRRIGDGGTGWMYGAGDVGGYDSTGSGCSDASGGGDCGGGGGGGD